MSIEISPNGIGIRFETKPYRRYYLMADATPAKVVDDEAWGEHVESVTGVLKVLDKPALPWWGMEIGLQGFLEAVARGTLRVKQDGNGYVMEINSAAADKKTEEYKKKEGVEFVTDAKRLAHLLTALKLTVNHVRDDAGARGKKAHSAFETWCETGIVPVSKGFPDDQRGYVEGIRKFVQEADLSTGRTEIMVGSLEHRFAGRYDWHGMYEGVPTLLDVKTSKGVTAGHFLQLAGYEGARRECGWRETERQGIIHVTPDGNWDVVWRPDKAKKDMEPVTYEDFLAVLRVHRVVKRLGGL